MDPNASLRRLLDACGAEDREEAAAALEDLLGWVSSGGFLPRDPTAGTTLTETRKR